MWRTKSTHSYFAAAGTIHWGVNGIAFTGGYLSAASFLGIRGMIATAGSGGCLCSIGCLAGWVVALVVVAEPMKRLGCQPGLLTSRPVRAWQSPV